MHHELFMGIFILFLGDHILKEVVQKGSLFYLFEQPLKDNSKLTDPKAKVCSYAVVKISN
jgi:hypothetical protein